MYLLYIYIYVDIDIDISMYILNRKNLILGRFL